MKNHAQNLLIVLTILLVTGCAANKSIYYWGDYSESAYQYKKEPTTDTLNDHKQSLVEIIENAGRKNKKIPPGIYAELAKIEIEANNLESAKELLSQEKRLFPESAIMVDALIKMIDGKESANASNS